MQALQLHCSELRIAEWWSAATAAAVRVAGPYSAARGLLDLVAAATCLQVGWGQGQALRRLPIFPWGALENYRANGDLTWEATASCTLPRVCFHEQALSRASASAITCTLRMSPPLSADVGADTAQCRRHHRHLHAYGVPEPSPKPAADCDPDPIMSAWLPSAQAEALVCSAA